MTVTQVYYRATQFLQISQTCASRRTWVRPYCTVHWCIQWSASAIHVVFSNAYTYDLGVNSAGSAIGAAACSYLADRFGRKRTIQVAALILSIGAGLCAGSVNNAMFMVGRVINGLGIGALVTAIPMYDESYPPLFLKLIISRYQAEVSTPESRGFMVSMHVCPAPKQAFLFLLC